MLELTREHYLKSHLNPINTDMVSPTQARSSDVEIASQWIVHGGATIRTRDNAILEGFERGAAKSTDFWSGETGVSVGRWSLWCDTMEVISMEEGLSDNAKKALRQVSDLFSIRSSHND